MDHSRFRCKFLKPGQIKEIVENFKKRYWPQNELPVNIERIIEQGLKLDIIPMHINSELAAVDAYLQSDLTGIVVDYKQYMDTDNRYEKRLRFSFAHEVGHLILHKELYSSLSINDLEDYAEFVQIFPDDEYESFEWQANEFAGNLLVPRDVLEEEVRNTYEILKKNRLLTALRNTPDMVMARVSPLIGKRFGVSDQVVAARLRVEKLWPPFEQD